MSLMSEIHEQPERLAAQLHRQRRTAEAIARQLRSTPVDYILLAARGTSDNAGRYANYLLGAWNGLPLAMATPSLFTYYRRPPRLKNALVIGISQSGQSPDIVSVLEEGRRQGCQTLAITNAPRSPLALAADNVLDIHAGPERAVAATKTYTAELLAIAVLASALDPSASRWRALERVPDWARQTLAQDPAIARAAERYRYLRQCVVLGRGYNYATAFEWALKLKELTYVVAEPYSTADFQHGPIAMVERGFPVLAVAPSGRVSRSTVEMLQRLRRSLAAELIVISNLQPVLALAQTALHIPKEVPEWLSPMIAILPAQLFAAHLTRIKGFSTERPRSIQKVTQTQ